MYTPRVADGHLLAVRCEPKSPDEWAFYFVNDTDDPIDELVLARVGYEWGDTGNEKVLDRDLGALGPRRFVLAWRDDSDGAELRMDLGFRLMTSRGRASLTFEVGKLYRRRDVQVEAPLLGQVCTVVRPE